MPPHRIHLRGPWEAEWVGREGDLPPEPLRVKMPGTWGGQLGDAAGSVCFRRSFGRPTNLDASGRVSLCFDGIGGMGSVRLNGTMLGEITQTESAARFDVTGQLQPRNVLEVELRFDPAEHSDEPGGLWGAVALEIENESTGT